MSRKPISFFVSLLFLCAGVAAFGQNGPPKAGVNLHGEKYIAFIPMKDGEFDPTAETLWPYYIVFGQEEDRLYGSIVGPYLEKPNGAPAANPNLVLLHNPLANGVVKGKRFTADSLTPETLKADKKLTGKLLKNGDELKLSMAVEGGNSVSIIGYRCGLAESYSGIYIGKAKISPLSAPAVQHNVVFGLRVYRIPTAAFAPAPSKMTYGCLYIDSLFGEELQGTSGAGTIDEETGEFESEEDSDNEANVLEGKISRFKMALNLISPNPQQKIILESSALRYFGSMQRTPRLKLKKTVSKVDSPVFAIVLTVKTRNVLPGALLTEDSPDLYIYAYGISSNILTVYFLPFGQTVPKTVNLTITNPDGKSATKTYEL
jgi:hypothetical protein